MVSFGPFYQSAIFLIPLIILIGLAIFNTFAKSRRKKLFRPSIVIAVVCILLVILQTIFGIQACFPEELMG